MFTSPYLDWTIERVALNAKVVGGPHGDKDKMVAVASESSIILWSVQDGGSGSEIGKCALSFLFLIIYIGSLFSNYTVQLLVKLFGHSE